MKKIKLRDIGIDLEKRRIEGVITMPVYKKHEYNEEAIVYIKGEEIKELLNNIKKSKLKWQED